MGRCTRRTIASTVAFYERATGLAASYYDRELGFALLGPEQAVAVASRTAGTLMMMGAKSASLYDVELAPGTWHPAVIGRAGPPVAGATA